MANTFLNIEYFLPFGKLVETKVPSKALFKGLVRKDNLEIHFNNLCNNLLEEKYECVNQIDFDNTISLILSNDPSIVQKVILSVIDNHTKNFFDCVQKKLNLKEYSNEWFITEYNKYVKRASVFKKTFRSMNDYVKLENNKNMLNILLNYLFYYNVINKKYDVSTEGQNRKLYIYEIMTKFNDIANIEEFFTLYKFYNYFLGFSFSLKEIRNLYFNTDLDNIFFNSPHSKSNQFHSFVIAKIDSDIKNLLNITDDTTEIEKAAKKIQDHIKMCLKFSDKTHFIVTYASSFYKRLQEKTTDFLIEKELLTSFKPKDELELYIKMMFCIEDMMISEFITQSLKNMKDITFSSDKWKTFDKSKVNNDMCDYTLIRNYAWEGSKYGKTNKYGQINLPLELDYFFTILKALLCDPNSSFSNDFVNRTIYLDDDNSNVTLDATFHNITYSLNMTLLQATVFIAINEHDGITAQSLEGVVGTSLKNLSIILNSLIKAKLIVREKVEKNNTNMSFNINENFVSTETRICLVTILEDLKNPQVKQIQTNQSNQPSQQGQQNEIVKQQTTLSQEDIEKLASAKNKLMVFFSKHLGKCLTLEQIKHFLSNNNANIKEQELLNILDRFTITKILKLSDGKYECLELEHELSSSESDSDDGSDSGSEENSDDESHSERDSGSDDETNSESDGESESGSNSGSDNESDDGSDNGPDSGSDRGSDRGSDNESDDGSNNGSDNGPDSGSDDGSDRGSGNKNDETEKELENKSELVYENTNVLNEIQNPILNITNKVEDKNENKESQHNQKVSKFVIRTNLIKYFNDNSDRVIQVNIIKKFLEENKIDAYHSDVKDVLDSFVSDMIIRKSGSGYIYNKESDEDSDSSSEKKFSKPKKFDSSASSVSSVSSLSSDSGSDRDDKKLLKTPDPDENQKNKTIEKIKRFGIQLHGVGGINGTNGTNGTNATNKQKSKDSHNKKNTPNRFTKR